MSRITAIDPSLETQIRYLYELYHNWYPTKANILVGTNSPSGSVAEREFSLFLNKNTGQVFYAADGGVWRVVADIKGPTGGIGPTGPTGPSNCRRHGHYDSCDYDCDDYHEGCHYDCEDNCRYKPNCGPSHVYTSPSNDCQQREEYCGFPYNQSSHHGQSSYHHGQSSYHHNQSSYHNESQGQLCCSTRGNHPLGDTPIPKVTQTEAVNITPLGLANSVLTLTAIPCTCNASIDVSFCGSFTNAINTMVQKAPTNGQVVITASTSFWNVSMTMDFISGQTKWSGAFNRALTLIPGTQNKVFISASFHSEENQTGITLMGVNDFISARLMYDI